MAFWNKILEVFKPNREKKVYPLPKEYLALMEFRKRLNTLLGEKRYISRKVSVQLQGAYEEAVKHFEVIIAEGLLTDFCRKRGVSEEDVLSVVDDFRSLAALTEQHNEEYVESGLIAEKEYLDGILKKVDENIVLDAEQRRVVLTDEDNCLVIAGAGAGKTTTIAAKVKYLVDRQGVKPDEILIISFTNKAVNELRERINGELRIDCPIATFHATGNAILRRHSKEKPNIVQQSKLYYCTQDYFRQYVLQDEAMVKKLVLFFASYFDAPFQGDDINKYFEKIAKSSFSTMKSDLNEVKEELIDRATKKCVTIQNEVLRSYQEVEIANFLYLNGLEYKYEPIYKYNIPYANKPYTPDFIVTQGEKTVYLEHFGITEDGKNNLFTPNEIERYKRAVNDKIKLHKSHGTRLLYTFSAYKDRKPLLEHLSEQLIDEGFTLVRRPDREVYEKLIANEENRYIRKLVALVTNFIRNFKTDGYGAEKFQVLADYTDNVRSKLFLNICYGCYLNYQRLLKENNAVDFEDMINESAKILEEAKENKLNFKYVIVDEYQDISLQRFDLTKALSEATDAKIVAVGDDWQSIYAFSGSDITLFTDFEKSVGYAKQMIINNTYRNSQEVIDIAGGFIQKNAKQIRKMLHSPKKITDPVIIYTYDSRYKKPGAGNRSGANYSLARATETAIGQIAKYDQSERDGKRSNILVLGRFNFDGDLLEKSGLFEYYNRGNNLKSVKYPDYNITFMTAHSSKGLGYDNVIVVNGKNEMYGFPSKIEDDPVMSFVIKQDRSIDYAEERRLFYVAMTRTKNRVFFVAPEQNPSEFLLEIKKDYKSVLLKGEWNEEIPFQYSKKKCPICGYPLRLRYKNAYGLRLYMCSNEPELCSFMTNKLDGGKLAIMKCPDCVDGYLIVKSVRGREPFLGCTNYKADRTGCNCTMSKKEYYEKFGYSLEAEEKQTETAVLTETTTVESEITKKAEKKEPKASIYTVKIPNIDTTDMKEPLVSLNDKIYTILSCLNSISDYRYRREKVLVDVLMGSEIKETELKESPYYASLAIESREEVEFIVGMLIRNNFIRKMKGKSPVLHPAIKGLYYDKYMDKKTLANMNRELKRERKYRTTFDNS